MKNDLMIFKRMFPELFPPSKIEEENETTEPDDKEVVPSESS